MKTITIILLALIVIGMTAIGCKQNEPQKPATASSANSASASQGAAPQSATAAAVSDSDLGLDQGNTEDSSALPEPSSDTSY